MRSSCAPALPTPSAVTDVDVSCLVVAGLRRGDARHGRSRVRNGTRCGGMLGVVGTCTCNVATSCRDITHSGQTSVCVYTPVLTCEDLYPQASCVGVCGWLGAVSCSTCPLCSPTCCRRVFCVVREGVRGARLQRQGSRTVRCQCRGHCRLQNPSSNDCDALSAHCGCCGRHKTVRASLHCRQCGQETEFRWRDPEATNIWPRRPPGGASIGLRRLETTRYVAPQDGWSSVRCPGSLPWHQPAHSSRLGDALDHAVLDAPGRAVWRPRRRTRDCARGIGFGSRCRPCQL